VKCGLILEFEDDEIERLQDKIALRLGGFTCSATPRALGRAPRPRARPAGHPRDQGKRVSDRRDYVASVSQSMSWF